MSLQTEIFYTCEDRVGNEHETMLDVFWQYDAHTHRVVKIIETTGPCIPDHMWPDVEDFAEELVAELVAMPPVGAFMPPAVRGQRPLDPMRLSALRALSWALPRV